LDALQADVDALKRLQAKTAAELDALLPPSSTARSKENCEIALSRIPTGFGHSAQGCRVGEATLGQVSKRFSTPTGLCHPRAQICHNPVGINDDFDSHSQGSSFLATAGLTALAPLGQTRWSEQRRIVAELAALQAEVDAPKRPQPETAARGKAEILETETLI
jgi:hypothetical protein